MKSFLFGFFVFLLGITSVLFFAFNSQVFALEKPEEDLNQVGVTPILGNKVDLNLQFTDSSGKIVKLQELVSGNRPTVIVPVYFHCPRLCGLILTGLIDLINGVTLKLGHDYRVVVVSFDTSEGADLAAERFKTYSEQLKNKPNTGDWHFLVGMDQNVTTLMNQIGFHYKRDGEEFAHSSAIILLTPEGEISQYFTGIEFPAWDVRLALVEASKGNIGSPLDHVLLFCFRFDQTKGKYTWAVKNLVRVCGAVTLTLLILLVVRLYRRERFLQASTS